MTGRTITLTTPTPPEGTTFAAVEIHATKDGETWRTVGAEPTRERRRRGDDIVEVLKPTVTAACHLEPDDVQIRALWACEDASRQPVVTTHDPNAGARRRLGGPR